ncbi:MAG: DUF1877 family protein [Streptosporangiales bacterium]|nr:DUF1877 family protein [Streptosporangiales bacterium]
MGLAMRYLAAAPDDAPVGDAECPDTLGRLFGAGEWWKKAGDSAVDVGESWQGIHYLLNGDPWEGQRPAADLVCGGVLLTVDDGVRDRIGCDVLYLDPARVKEVAEHLAATPFDKLTGRFDPKAMDVAGVQGADAWASQPTKKVLDKVLKPAYQDLVKLFGAAASSGHAVFKTMG